MVITFSSIEVHWNYFLAIEDDLERLSRFIEFDERNFNCFSIENARILLTAGAEVDVVSKQICRKLNPNSSADSINQYRDEITAVYSTIPDFEVFLPRFGPRFKPWDNWSQSGVPPFWWTAYNKVKHHRYAEYHRANLENVLKSVGGLFVLVLYLYIEKARVGELNPSPKLLRVSEDRSGGVSTAMNAILYNL